MRRSQQVAITALSASVVAMLAAAPPGLAAVPRTGGSHLEPAGAAVAVAAPAGIGLDVTVSGFPATLSCADYVAHFVVPAAGVAATYASPPRVTDCADSFGGSDLWTSRGRPTLTFAHSASGPDTVTMTLPPRAAEVTVRIFEDCVVVLAPDGPAKITGSYDPTAGVAVFDQASVPLAGQGCPTPASGALSATLRLTPAVTLDAG